MPLSSFAKNILERARTFLKLPGAIKRAVEAEKVRRDVEAQLREREIEVPKAPKAIPLVRAELFRQSVQRFVTGVPSDKELTKQFRELRSTGVPEKRAREQLEENIVTTIKRFPTVGRFEGLEIEPTGRVTLKGDLIDISGAFGALRTATAKLTRKVLRKIAKSTNVSEIFGIIKKEVTEISDSLARKLSRDFKDIK
ncbi:hypothetical protein LCGC14_1503070, partial [marine sediment metagenome]